MSSPVRIAAFDLDDTVLEGDSQLLFVRYLAERRLAPVSLLAEVAFWFALHRVGLTLEVPKLYARIIARCSTIGRDALTAAMREFAETRVTRRIRGDAQRWMARVRADGCHVVLLSASVEPIVAAVAASMPVDGYVSTQLTRAGRVAVDGEMVYAEAKIRALQAYADARFPSWRLEYAFGNDFGDRFLLSAAAHPVAVCPSPRLRACAQREGWPCTAWQ